MPASVTDLFPAILIQEGGWKMSSVLSKELIFPLIILALLTKDIEEGNEAVWFCFLVSSLAGPRRCCTPSREG